MTIKRSWSSLSMHAQVRNMYVFRYVWALMTTHRVYPKDSINFGIASGKVSGQHIVASGNQGLASERLLRS